MYKGKMTEELINLFNEYYGIFGCCPDEYDDVEYFEDGYDKFVEDIKKCLKKKKEIPEI